MLSWVTGLGNAKYVNRCSRKQRYTIWVWSLGWQNVLFFILFQGHTFFSWLRDRERGREISIGRLLVRAPAGDRSCSLGMWVCLLARNQTCELLVYCTMLQQTEPHWPGWHNVHFNQHCFSHKEASERCLKLYKPLQSNASILPHISYDLSCAVL